MSDISCSHIGAITTIKRAHRRECEECVKSGAPLLDPLRDDPRFAAFLRRVGFS